MDIQEDVKIEEENYESKDMMKMEVDEPELEYLKNPSRVIRQ